MMLLYLVQLALLHVVASLNMQVEGSLAIELQVANSPSAKGRWFRVSWDAGKQPAHELVFKTQQNVTMATPLECIYQYPEKKQVDALLSNIMNELTRVFVRANQYMNGLDSRPMFMIRGSDPPDRGQEEKTEVVKEKPRDKRTRFRVIHKKENPYFESVYNNMTEEYRNYNATLERAKRSRRDPCAHQPEVKQMWRELLQHAQKTLKSAVTHCFNEYLVGIPVEEKAQVRKRLKQFLKAELSKVRANQINMLCDTYQLCYHDLLK